MFNYTDADKNLLAEISGRMVREPISTTRVLLRPFRRSDLMDFYAYASQKEQQRLSGNCSCDCLEDAEAGLNFFLDPSHPPYAFAIELKAEQKVIGNVSITRYPAEELDEKMLTRRGIALSYILNEAYWNRGIMTEILESLYAMLFAQAELDYIHSGYFLYNGASGRVQEKLGMKPWKEGVWEWNGGQISTREMVIWREDWEKRKKAWDFSKRKPKSD